MNEENVNNPYAEGIAQRRGLVERAKNMIVKPKLEWGVVASESPDVAGITMGYALPLILISAVASLIGYGIIGLGIPGTETTFIYGLAYALLGVISSLVSLYLVAAIVKMLGPTFDSSDDFGRAFQIVAYGMTPAWVAGIFNIIPFLGTLIVIAGFIYAIYLYYIGLPPVMGTPQNRVAAYMVITAIVTIVLWLVLAAILTPIIFGIFGLSVLGSAMF